MEQVSRSLAMGTTVIPKLTVYDVPASFTLMSAVKGEEVSVLDHGNASFRMSEDSWRISIGITKSFREIVINGVAKTIALEQSLAIKKLPTVINRTPDYRREYNLLPVPKLFTLEEALCSIMYLLPQQDFGNPAGILSISKDQWHIQHNVFPARCKNARINFIDVHYNPYQMVYWLNCFDSNNPPPVYGEASINFFVPCV